MADTQPSGVQCGSCESSAERGRDQTVNPRPPSAPFSQPPASLLPDSPRPLDFSCSYPPPSLPELTRYMGSSFSSLFPTMSSQVPGGEAANVSAAEDSLFVDQHATFFENAWSMTEALSNTQTPDDVLFTLPSSEGEDELPASHAAEGQPESEIMGLLSLRDIFKTEEQSISTPSGPAQTQTAATAKEKAPEKPQPKPKAPPKSRAAPKTQKNTASRPAKPHHLAKNAKTAQAGQNQSQTPKPSKRRKTAPKVSLESEIESRLLVPPSTPLESPHLKWGNLETVINSGSAQAVAQALRASRPFLANLAEAIHFSFDRENGGTGAGVGREWAARVQKLAQAVDVTTSTSRRLLIGVVGRTGTGKSSIINSVLDEGRVVPTNGLRACTAVVTEIAWNTSDNPQERYMAQIELLQPEMWQKEVARLYEDVKDELEGEGSGTYDDADDNAQSKIAFDKLRSVFPHLIKGKESIFSGDCTVDTLLQDAKVNRLLGSMQTVRAADAEAFYSQIKEYLGTRVISSSEGGELAETEADMAEPTTSAADTEGKEEEMQLWPLINVVRIYVKADILSTGVVLVDLPGFGDANLARDAIAESYLLQCSALWIISPITRAVDDKEARALLDRSFRRQLSLDGTVNNLTFVCSKTDDIDIRETTESLSNATHAVKQIYRKITISGHEIKAESDKMTTMHQVEEPELVIQLEAAEKGLREALPNGKGANSTGTEITESTKRDAEEALQGEDDSTVGKRAKVSSFEPAKEGDIALSLGELCQSDRTEVGEAACAASDAANDTAATVVDSLAINHGEALQQQTRHRDALAQKLAILRECKVTTEAKYFAKVAEKEALEKEAKLVCVQMRNEYSRKRIKQDFAQGQKELDEETTATALGKKKGRRTAKGKRGGNKKPEPMRDYAELAKKLPVFCVSSRAYQTLRVKESGDPLSPLSQVAISGMQHANDTEIPQLQQHVKKTSAEHEMEHGRAVLQSLLQLLASLSAWAGCDGQGGGAVNLFGSGVEVHLTPEQEEQLNKSFLQLRESLSEATDKFVGGLVDIMDTKVLTKMAQLVQKSQDEAPKIVAVWARARPKGGLMWQSYRAICRNKGYKTASKTSRSFTEELISTLLDGLVPTWTSAFNTKVPAALASYKTQMDRAVDRFHREMKQHCERQTHQVLLQSVRSVQQQLRRAVHTTGSDIETFRKTVIQQPRACACAVMGPIYESCAREAGKGCLGRMRTSMAEHVDREKDAMYAQMEVRARNELAFFVNSVIPASLPSRTGRLQQSQPIGSHDDGAVHPDVLLSMFFGECRCLMGKAYGTVTDTMQSAQENIREVLKTVASVFSEV